MRGLNCNGSLYKRIAACRGHRKKAIVAVARQGNAFDHLVHAFEERSLHGLRSAPIRSDRRLAEIKLKRMRRKALA
ncbi:MAG: hypothetical protein QXO92_03265 [Candidatus Bathyarchaeia archaeon]